MSLRHYFWSSGEPWRSVRSWAVPRILRALHTSLICTLHITTSGVWRARPFLEERQGNGALFVVWHDTMLLPMHLFRNKDIGVIVSHSRAGQMGAALWSLYGWPVIWGSTKKRQGVPALREAIERLRAGQSIGFTPDGPLGPRHHAQPGVVLLAARAPAAVMPVGVAAAAAWRLRTWDRHLIPRPFTHVHIHLGEPLRLPPDIPRQEIASWQRIITDAIEQAEATAREKLKGKR